jgi:hypothetical protein
MKEVFKVKFCNKCKAERNARLVRNITKSGISQVYWLCRCCDSSTTSPIVYIRHDLIKAANINPDELPVINNYSGTQLCAVCNSPFAEYHHWAPRYLFEDAENWPGSYLCIKCHSRWHTIVTPEMAKVKA